MKKIKEIPYLKKRLIMCIVGVLLSGISVGFFKRAAFGVDPFQSLMAGLDTLIPISFGTLYVIVNAVLLLFSLFADRHYIGLATLINLFFLGYVAQFSLHILTVSFPDLGLPGRSVCLAIGLFITCLSASLYFEADLGVSTYDAVALIITKTWKKGQFRFVRIATDFICVVVGVFLYFLAGGKLGGIGAVVGVGTIITACLMGPVIELFRKKFAQPLLYGKEASEVNFQ